FKMAAPLKTKCWGLFSHKKRIISIFKRHFAIREDLTILAKEDREYPAFDEIKKELAAVDEEIAARVDIGLEPQTFRAKPESRKDWRKRVSKLEETARHRTLKIPLDEVSKEWQKESSSEHNLRIADHYGVYKDLFGYAYFSPVKPLAVTYNGDSNESVPVYTGNVLTPSQARDPPIVNFEADPADLYTLVLSNPDGNLIDPSKETLHMLIGNIPGNAVQDGETLCDYLQPFPPKGVGYQRLVFILYKQEKKLDFSNEKRPDRCISLQERTFCTQDFYRAYEDDLTPVGLSFFQTQWEKNVTEVYHNILEMKAPEFEYDWPVEYHPKQKKYPLREPFNKYLDRYRCRKDIQDEVAKERLRMNDPFLGDKKQYKYPLAIDSAGDPTAPDHPFWIREREALKKLRRGYWKDLEKK
ncbi:unnamed protein product, partial [Owenia fusiformis]